MSERSQEKEARLHMDATPARRRRPRVYVAGPISGGKKYIATVSHEQMEARAKTAIHVGQELLDMGFAPFVPHLSVWWDKEIPGNSWDAWLELDEAWIEKADLLVRIPGESEGADREVELARSLNIPVYYWPQDQAKMQVAHLDPYRLIQAGGTAAAGEERITNPSTGGQKGRKRERFELLPWDQLAKVARLYAAGASKYADHNWRRGYDWSLSFGAMMRHAASFWHGESMDPETREHHLASVIFHALALLWFEEMFPELDDRFVVGVVKQGAA